MIKQGPYPDPYHISDQNQQPFDIVALMKVLFPYSVYRKMNAFGYEVFENGQPYYPFSNSLNHFFASSMVLNILKGIPNFFAD